MYLWIDLWNKKCWIALEIEKIVVPKSIVSRVKLISELKKLIKEYGVTHIIVWLPYDLYNKDKTQLNKTKKFIDKLKNIFPEVFIDSIDESFTSFEADNILSEMWISSNQREKDDLSAALILENYIKNLY